MAMGQVELVASNGCQKVELHLEEPLRLASRAYVNQLPGATSFEVLQKEHFAAPQYKHPATRKDLLLQAQARLTWTWPETWPSKCRPGACALKT